MIARIWHGIVPAKKADDYYLYLQKTGLKDYQAIAGNLVVFVLRRIEDDKAHFTLITHWESMDAIRKFAGDEPEKAVYYPEDSDYLLEFEEFVAHHDILFAQNHDGSI